MSNCNSRHGSQGRGFASTSNLQFWLFCVIFGAFFFESSWGKISDEKKIRIWTKFFLGEFLSNFFPAKKMHEIVGNCVNCRKIACINPPMHTLIPHTLSGARCFCWPTHFQKNEY